MMAHYRRDGNVPELRVNIDPARTPGNYTYNGRGGDSGDLQRQIDYLQNANLALLDQNAQLVDALSKAQAVQAVLAAPKRRFLPPWRWGRKNRE